MTHNYKSQKIMEKQKLINEIFSVAYRKSGGTGLDKYYRISPKPITMDNGEVVNVEWVQPSIWTNDVLINYRTDCLKTTELSCAELEQILKVI